jgi:chromosome segregation ATPase
MTALHSELVEQVNQKWGLERGSNMEETKARHRSTEEYKRELVSEVCDLEHTRQGLLRQIRRAEIKLKGISTMIANLRERKQAIQDEIDEIARQFGQDGCDHAALASRMAALRSELEAVKDKLSLRQQMLEDAERTILAARARLAALKQEHAEIREHLGADFNYKTTELQKNLLATYNDMVASSWEPVRPTLSEHQQRSILDESGFTHLTDNAAGVINCALIFSLSTASVRPLPMPSPMVAAPSTIQGWGRDRG